MVCSVVGAWFWCFSFSRQATTSITPDKNRGPVRATMHPPSDYYIQTLAYLGGGQTLGLFNFLSSSMFIATLTFNTLVSTLANLTLIILFSEMLKIFKNYFFQITKKNFCEK
jgi:hypothetical protein